jgi:broad specificity phosphatase PhoE/aminoglycoside phosphotransferase (APT) family kinase protein
MGNWGFWIAIFLIVAYNAAMKLFLVRHGQSLGNAKPGFISGKTDPDGLTTGGRAQIIRTAWELRNLPFDRMIASPVARAKESASILSHLLGLPFETQPFLAEFHYGVFERSFWWHRSEVERQQWQQAMGDFSTPVPGGDSYERFSARVWNGFQRYMKASNDTQVLMVAHDVVISTLLFCLLYGHPSPTETTASYKKAYLRFINDLRVANGSVLEVDCDGDPATFRLFDASTGAVAISAETVQWYLRGMKQATDVSIREQYTASENKVFHVTARPVSRSGSGRGAVGSARSGGAAGSGEQQEQINAIVKLMEEREVVASERMQEIYTYLATQTKIPAPRILFYDKSTAFYADSVLVQDFLEGENQVDYLNAHSKQTMAMLTDTLKQIQAIHAIPVSDVAEFWYPDDTSPHKVHAPWHRYIATEIDETLTAVAQLELSTDRVKAVEKALSRLAKLVRTQTDGLVPLHGDLSPQNIVVGQSSQGKACCIRILDFERGRIGDPVWDYAYYAGWLDRDLPQIVDQWDAMVSQELSSGRDDDALLERYRLYRVLFHAWTARDGLEYVGSDLRQSRGSASVDWLAQVKE